MNVNSIAKIFSRYTRESIFNRYLHYDFFYEYYISYKEYPPITLCQKIQCSIFKKSDPNKFDYFFIPDKRKEYTLPLLFTRNNIRLRQGSNISKNSVKIRTVI